MKGSGSSIKEEFELDERAITEIVGVIGLKNGREKLVVGLGCESKRFVGVLLAGFSKKSCVLKIV